MASKGIFIIFLIQIQLIVIRCNIVLQSEKTCGSNMQPRVEKIKDLSEFQASSHIGRDYYAPHRDCVVTIIGEKFHQWEIVLESIDIDDHQCRVKSPCCNDYLKLFNAYTIDNARLFPTIPWRGLCGNTLPKRTTFTSTQNYITIQFNSDLLADSKRGFSMRMRQYPRRNAGNDFFESGFVGGWNDGSLNELQIDWNEQGAVPGDFLPGKDNTFEFDPNGIDCYSCAGCKKDYFKPDNNGVAVSKGCYVCTKEWKQGTASATRECLSRNLYQEKLLTLRDVSGSSVDVSNFRSCKTFARGDVGRNYIKLCVCDSDECNTGRILTSGSLSIAFSVIVSFFLLFR